MVHLTAPIGATFLKQCFALKKIVEPSAGTTKRQRVESTTEDAPIDPPTEDILVGPTAAAPDDDDEDDADLDADAAGPFILSPSLHDMMEKFMMTQALMNSY